MSGAVEALAGGDALSDCPLVVDIQAAESAAGLRLRIRAAHRRPDLAALAAFVIFDSGTPPVQATALALNIRRRLEAARPAFTAAPVPAPLPADRASWLLFAGACAASLLAGAGLPTLFQVLWHVMQAVP